MDPFLITGVALVAFSLGGLFASAAHSVLPSYHFQKTAKKAQKGVTK